MEFLKKIHNFKGTEGTLEFIQKEMSDTIIVHFDPDIDGEISGLLVCRFLNMLGKRFQWYINENRAHGWGIPLEKVSGRDVIAVDFLIEPQEVLELTDAGVNLLSIDHHVNVENFIEIESDYGNRGYVINNQYPFEEEDGRYLSGAGVVFEVLSSVYPEFDTKENRALVGITLLSDVRNIENPYARFYLRELYEHKMRGIIGYFIKHTIGEVDYKFGVPRMDRNFVDYTFSPVINSLLRFNMGEMATRFFLGSGEIDLSYHSLQKQLVNEIQSKLKVVKYSKLIVCYFFEKDLLDDHGEVCLENRYFSKDILSNFVGLVASRYLDGTHSCICYMISEKNGKKSLKRASLRGNVNGLDYRTALSKKVEGVGHPSAFGIKHMRVNSELFKWCNAQCEELEENAGYKRKIIECSNLSFFMNSKGKKIALENMYLLTQHMTYVRYIGSNIKRRRSGANYIEYNVDGIPVMCFDKTVTFETGIISIMQERSIPCLYLQPYTE